MSALPPAAAVALWAVLGAVFGSFATAASWRLPRGMPIAAGRSACQACGTTLGWRDLFPVLSWLAAGGRCRHCGAPVGWRYPATEAATAALFVLCWLAAPDLPRAALLAATALGLVIATVTDLETGIIPDKVLLALIPVAVAWRWLTDGDLLDMALGAAVGFGLGLAVRSGFRLVRGRHGLGLGDVKFLGIAGLYLGAAGLAPFLVIGGLLGVALGALWRWRGGGAQFPFGPALAAALLALLLRPELAGLVYSAFGVAPPERIL